MRKVFSFFPLLWTNWITLLGAVVTGLAGGVLIVALVLDFVAPLDTPYANALAFLIAPFFFVGGLGLIPLGRLWARRQRRRKGETPDDKILAAFRLAMDDKKARRRILWFGLATLVNVIIIAAVGHKAVSWMDSPNFCGMLCHRVMEPEYNAYRQSPHSRVPCVGCHIGPGASWAVKAKITGLRQVWGVLTGNYDRPIPTPVQALRPARDTCEQCHWPAKFHGNRVALFPHFQSDEKNSARLSAVLLKVGGKDPRTHAFRGIHWHVSPDTQVRYQALDGKREKIGKVTRLDRGQVTAEYLPPGGEDGNGEERVMDCVDCHNRPSHIFDRSPEAAIDRAFADGRLDVALPFLRALSVPLLSRNDLARAEAGTFFDRELDQAYEKEHPEAKPKPEAIHAAAKVLASLFRHNVYPTMNIGWGTYTVHLGHGGDEKDRRGCFRCHDDEHKTKDGKAISQDCDLCHEILSQEEPPDKIPESLRSLLPEIKVEASAAP